LENELSTRINAVYLYLKKNKIVTSETAFGDAMNTSRTSIINYKSGKSEVPFSFVQNLIQKYRLNEKWVVFGVGDMFKQEAPAPPKGIIETQQEQIALLWESIAQLKDNAQRDREKIQNLERKVTKTG